MQCCWPPEDLADHWTLTADELRLLDPKTDHNRLGFALLLKFFAIEGRFPRSPAEVSEAAVTHVGRQVGVTPQHLRSYKWRGRAIKDHRAQIREALGFRSASVEDAQALTAWLSSREEAPTATLEHLKALFYQRGRELRLGAAGA